jgi:hypothetical protein
MRFPGRSQQRIVTSAANDLIRVGGALVGLVILLVGVAIMGQRWVTAGLSPRTPTEELLLAAMDGDAAKVAEALAHGAAVDGRDERGLTALMWVVHLDNPPAAEALIRAGADLSAVDCRGMTPLHHAVATDCRPAVRLLLEHGADPNAVSKGGVVPLGQAIVWRDAEMVDLLLAHGANAQVGWGDGTTPVSFCEQFGDGCAEVRASLIRAGNAGPVAAGAIADASAPMADAGTFGANSRTFGLKIPQPTYWARSWLEWAGGLAFMQAQRLPSRRHHVWPVVSVRPVRLPAAVLDVRRRLFDLPGRLRIRPAADGGEPSARAAARNVAGLERTGVDRRCSAG